jgi:hypothetical protein
LAIVGFDERWIFSAPSNFQEVAMSPDNAPRNLSFGRPSALSLALATAIACIVIGVCRLITHVASFDRAELDGIAFMAAVYWVLSAVGYFAPRSASIWAAGGSVWRPKGIRGREGLDGVRCWETTERRPEKSQGTRVGNERRAPVMADR